MSANKATLTKLLSRSKFSVEERKDFEKRFDNADNEDSRAAVIRDVQHKMLSGGSTQHK